MLVVILCNWKENINKKAIIGVVGLVIGLPLILNAKAKGFITYFDSDKKKILNLKKICHLYLI